MKINDIKKRLHKALECHNSLSINDCAECPYHLSESCIKLILLESIEIIELLEMRNKENENGYAQTSFLDRCKLHDAEEEIKNLKKEIERLRK